MKNKYSVIIIVSCFLLGLLWNWNNLRPRDYCRDAVDANLYKEKKAINEKGDTAAYKILVDSMRTDKRLSKGSYFYYSFIMATIYEYTPANFDVYCALRDVYNGLDSMDVDTKYMAMFFLKRGKERGDNRCEKELKQIENDNKKETAK